MKKLGIVLFIVVIALGGWYWYSTQLHTSETPIVTTATTTTARLSDDLYPLYPDATWGTVESATSSDYGEVTVVESTPITNTTNIASTSMPFMNYYNDKLVALGWSQDMSREAGGPGAEVSFYTKGDQFIAVSFHSIFKILHTNAPSECPCDVHLALMSGTQTGPTLAETLAAKTYHDATVGFSVILPTVLATSTSDSQWSVDPTYKYAERGPNNTIAGVKFTIPSSLATGTNLSSDSYVSVEHLPQGQKCDASSFMMTTGIKSQTIREGVLSYSVASTTDAAVGNRYEETVYARTDSKPCVAVRYRIHYGAIQNYPAGKVREFDRASLLGIFDDIRRTLALSQ